jgi:hypothetical protein
MATNNPHNINVGMTLFVVEKQHRSSSVPKFRFDTVTKIGSKYFTTEQTGTYKIETVFLLETLVEYVKNYDNYLDKAYVKEQTYHDEVEAADLYRDLYNYFSRYSYNNKRLSLETLYQITTLLDIKKEK